MKKDKAGLKQEEQATEVQNEELTEQDLTQGISNVSQALVKMANMFSEMTERLNEIESRVKNLEDKMDSIDYI